MNGPTGEYGYNTNHYNDVNGYIIDLSKEEAEVIGKLLPTTGGFSNPHDVAISADGDMIFVAETNPPVIHKFMHKSKVALNQTNELTLKSNVKQREQLIAGPNDAKSLLSTTDIASATEQKVKGHHPAATAILVAFLMSFFIFMTFALAVFVARRRRRRGNSSTIGGTLSIGQPNELVYRKLVDSNQQLADRQQS